MGVLPLLVADQADRLSAEAAETADDRRVLAKFAVPRERREVLDETLHVIGEMRPSLDPRHLGLLPGRKRAIEIRQRLGGFRLEFAEFLA